MDKYHEYHKAALADPTRHPSSSLAVARQIEIFQKHGDVEKLLVLQVEGTWDRLLVPIVSKNKNFTQEAGHLYIRPPGEKKSSGPGQGNSPPPTHLLCHTLHVFYAS